MSADNAVYLRPMPDGKIAVKCINSLYHETLTDAQIDVAFKDAPKFPNLDRAWEEEERIQDQYEKDGGYIEYGSEVIQRQDNMPAECPGCNAPNHPWSVVEREIEQEYPKDGPTYKFKAEVCECAKCGFLLITDKQTDIIVQKTRRLAEHS